MTIALQNQSKDVSEKEAQAIATALDSWLWYHVAPALAMTPVRCVYYPKGSPIPMGAYPLVLFAHPDQADALGYHYVDPQGRPYGRVFTEPVLAAGGGVLVGSDSVSGTAAHEAAEIVGDPFANDWIDMPDGRQTAREECDAVQGDDYEIRLPKANIAAMVCNFLLPAWFSNGPGPYDYRHLLQRPFTMRPGGYMLVRSAASDPEAVFGERVPSWKRELKMHPGSRTCRRLAATHPALFASKLAVATQAIPEAPC